MQNVYAIHQYNESNGTCHLAGLYETEEIATQQLRIWEDEIKNGLWNRVEFLKWHDSDEEEVTWMKYVRRGYDPGTKEVICCCVEVCPVNDKATRSVHYC